MVITGHRPSKLGGYSDNPVRKQVQAMIEKAFLFLKPDKIITGMALGVDQWAAALAIRHNIPFIAAVPCMEHEIRWTDAAQKRYFKILDQAAEVVVVTKAAYTSAVMQKRNIWMIDHGDTVLAVWDGSKSGTANCVAYAQKQGKNIYRITPGDDMLQEVS